MAGVEYDDVWKQFAAQADDKAAVRGLSLDIDDRELLVLLGPSGCGKTTALRMLAGLEEPDRGDIRIGGKSVVGLEPKDRDVALVFQSYALYPHLSAQENIRYPLKVRGLSRAEQDRKVERVADMLGIGHLLPRRPAQLSGGEQQRVALARAIVREPRVFLMDEPLSNLDAKLRDAMRLELREIQKSSGVTTIFVTHDQTEALTLCDRVAVMNAGRIEQVASPRDIYDRPATRFVATFVGRSNQMPATRDAAGNPVLGGIAVKGPAAARPAGEIDVFLRPQRIVLGPASDPVSDDLNALPGRVTSVLFVGDRLEIAVETPAGLLLAEMPSTHDAPPVGTAVVAAWRPEDTLFFPQAAP